MVNLPALPAAAAAEAHTHTDSKLRQAGPHLAGSRKIATEQLRECNVTRYQMVVAESRYQSRNSKIPLTSYRLVLYHT